MTSQFKVGKRLLGTSAGEPGDAGGSLGLGLGHVLVLRLEVELGLGLLLGLGQGVIRKHQLIDAVVLALAPQLPRIGSPRHLVALRRAQEVQDMPKVRAVPVDEEVLVLSKGQSVPAREHAPDHR
eukprot:CAMPEP_0173332816 /NCGR_PEP_ID=MMETSP1144-20121109/4547_1 /TAXON_ID=483371 /ORGANISM="non described non described, Strain CCMP2298" /LENGTH=124 /DNA_ID=CAMNT_0014277711 /DNA_START=402 /DNA_END=773 /DNA_ORIENTATION=+